MKHLTNVAVLLGIFVLTGTVTQLALAQIDDASCGTTTALNQPGTIPQAMVGTVGRGGKEITNQGTLRVLVIFVRFADDVQTTFDWPDYTTLPSWAQNIVDPSVPSPGGTYTPKNLSDFFDRCSGGDGSSNLGVLRVIGDVYYVTTDSPRSSYNSDGAVNLHVCQKLDNPQGQYRINFALYDNWKFIKNSEYYNHENVPDGKVDYIFMNWRKESISGEWLGIKTLHTSFATNDGITIQPSSGSTQHRYLEMGPFNGFDNWKARTIYVPAHEFTHYIFGGGHYTDFGINRGNIDFFALMTGNTLGSMCAHERYRAGWLNPDVIQQNESNRILQDTHVKNKALMLPIRSDASGNPVEYFLIENFHTQNDYTGADPFLRRQVFDHYLVKGLLVYHIENEDLTDPTYSNLDIECADGLWQWNLSAGQATPCDRSDDWIFRDVPSPNGSQTAVFDERDQIFIQVSSCLNQYQAATPTGSPDPRSRYTRNAILGDNEDFFRENETDVFSRWSNPSTIRADLVVTDKAFEIASYNPSTKEYTLKVMVTYNGALGLKPSKPQNLQVGSVKVGSGQYRAKLTWAANVEPDMMQSGAIYEIYRGIGAPGASGLIATVPYTQTTYTDNSVIVGPGGLLAYYRIKAKDTQALQSVYSDEVNINCSNCQNKQAAEEEVIPQAFSLSQNYPNPFNPTTTIKFDLPEPGKVSLIIYDVLGRKVAELVDEERAAGYHSITWNAADVASGVYLAHFIVSDAYGSSKYSKINKLILMK